MKYVTILARVLMGLIFAAGGIAYFFTPAPTLPPGPIADFFNGLTASRYFFNLLKVTEIVCGLLLIAGFFVPLALVILAPIVLNIFLVHIFIAPDPTSIAVAIFLGVCESYLAFISPQYSPTIKQLFRAK